jgi:hypothetical protein
MDSFKINLTYDNKNIKLISFIDIHHSSIIWILFMMRMISNIQQINIDCKNNGYIKYDDDNNNVFSFW